MAEAQTRSAAQDVIYLAGCAVKQEIPDPARLGDTEAIYACAAQHKLTAAVAMALESAGQRDGRSSLAIANALKRKALFERAYAQVKAALEGAGIWYMPLKGLVLKDYYPKPGMREMGDHDILFDAERAGDVKAIMEGLGFSTVEFGIQNHDVYHREPVCHFEMHRALMDAVAGKRLCAYYGDIEKRLIGDGFEKRFSPEDFYLYLIAHEYKHYCLGGTGLRSLLDTCVYLNRETLDMGYVAAEAAKMGMADFEAANRALALRLFSGGALTEADGEMLDYMMASGVYGTVEHRVDNRLSRRRGGRLRYLLNRFLVPVSGRNGDYAAMSAYYPFFYRHRILLPLLPLYRLLRGIRNGRLIAELKALRRTKA